VTARNSLEGAILKTEFCVSRTQLLQHFRRLYCGVPEVVLSGPLRGTGVAPSSAIIVITAGLSDIEHLPTEIGVKLKPMIGTLSCLEGDQIDVRLEAHHLVLASDSRRIESRPCSHKTATLKWTLSYWRGSWRSCLMMAGRSSTPISPRVWSRPSVGSVPNK